MWESLGTFNPSPIGWISGPSLGIASNATALLLLPTWEPIAGKYLGRLSFRREYDTAPGDLPDAVDEAFGYWPVQGQGRIYRLDSIPAPIPTILKMRIFPSRWLSRFGPETVEASSQVINLEVKRWAEIAP